VEVSHDEGVASHIGPESCVACREVRDEALTGERAGQPLSRDRFYLGVPTPLRGAEGKTDGCASASAQTTPRGQRPWHARMLLAREPGDLLPDRRRHGRTASGRPEGRSR
jgi:hypothetical protein